MATTGNENADVVSPVLTGLFSSPTHDGTSVRGTFPCKRYKAVAAFVDSSAILQQLERWRAEDAAGGHPGGRPASITDRQVLIPLLLLASNGEPLHITRLTEVLTSRLPRNALTDLGLPGKSDADYGAMYHRLRRALRALVAVIDPKPGTGGRRRTLAEVEAIKEGRDPAESAKKQQRLEWVTNALLEATLTTLPAHVRAQWQGNICVDATPVGAWGKRGSPGKPKKGTHGVPDPQALQSPEFDAGWYHRAADHRDPLDGRGRQNSKSKWAYETHFGVIAPNDPKVRPDFPLLVIGMTTDRPAGRIGENATTLIRSVRERGHPAGLFTGDRAYLPNSKPEKLQYPLRALGYGLCCDYREDQLGIQGHYGGAILVEGHWYCPSMPDALINATKLLRAGSITDDVYAQRIAQRTQYLFRPKSKPDADGHVIMRCPAAGPSPTTSCPLKPRTTGLGMPTTRITAPPTDPPPVCTNNESSTFPHTAGGKYAQTLQYGTVEWHDNYSTARNTVEAFNAYIKDSGHEDLENGGRRRVRGYAMQTLLIACLVASANLRKIRAYLIRTTKPDYHPNTPRPRAKRRTETLRDYLPEDTAPPGDNPAPATAA